MKNNFAPVSGCCCVVNLWVLILAKHFPPLDPPSFLFDQSNQRLDAASTVESRRPLFLIPLGKGSGSLKGNCGAGVTGICRTFEEGAPTPLCGGSPVVWRPWIPIWFRPWGWVADQEQQRSQRPLFLQGCRSMRRISRMPWTRCGIFNPTPGAAFCWQPACMRVSEAD